MRRIAGGLLGAALALAVFAPGAAAQGADGVELLVEPTPVSLSLGGSFDIGVEVTNTSESRLAEMVIHIDVTEPSSSTSVDPEDWVSTLSRRVDGLNPGETAIVRWSLKPIAGGEFVLYAVAFLPGDVEAVAVSNGVPVAVASQRTLNPEGVLPVVVAAPLVVGSLLAVQWRVGRRRRVG